MASTPLLLSLPTEVRNLVYEHAVPVRRLAAQEIVDVEWSRAPSEGRAIPGLLFVNKAVYQQTIPIFYSQAILEVTPIRPPSFIFNALNGPSHQLDLAAPLDPLFSFCPGQHLRWIRTVHVFTGQRDAINAEAYEATLRWLLDHTAVHEIHLSSRLMTRLRRSRVDLESAFKLTSSMPFAGRPVYIYSRSARSTWELTRMSELKKALRGRQLPELQIYLFKPDCEHDPLLDPRWDVRNNDDDERLTMVDAVARHLDSFQRNHTALPLLMPNGSRPTSSPDEYLYQVCFVLGTDRQYISTHSPWP